VASRLYGVIGNGGVLGGLRHPTMHPMQPLRRGLGLCHVRTQVAMDEPPAQLPETLPHLTESVLGYLEVVSRETPVIYAVIEDDEQAACGWRDGRHQLGPVRSHGPRPRRRLFRREPAAVDAALRWLGAPGSRAVGLDERADWEPGGAT
jgi:hypothetical protein